MKNKKKREKVEVGHIKDVEYSAEFADEADVIAQKRAAEANRRVKNMESTT